MTTEFDRYAIERTMRTYSNDLLSARQHGVPDLHNAIARAQSMLADMRYLVGVATGIEEQIKDAQRKAA